MEMTKGNTPMVHWTDFDITAFGCNEVAVDCTVTMSANQSGREGESGGGPGYNQVMIVEGEGLWKVSRRILHIIL